MTQNKLHKFDQNLHGISYRQYLKDAYAGVIALIRELEGILGKKRTHEIVEKYYTQNALEGVKRIAGNLDSPLESIEEFAELVMNLKDSTFAQQCQTDEFKASEAKTFQFCTNECLYAEVFRDMDASDLGLIMLCNGDIASAEAFHPNIRLERTKTLMQGDDCCDFKYVWED